MRVGLDATPLLGPRTGVGHYVARLVEALALSGEVAELRLIPFTWRGTSGPAVTPAAPRRESGGPAEQGAPGAVAGVRVGRRAGGAGGAWGRGGGAGGAASGAGAGVAGGVGAPGMAAG